ncbi:hypothetical protein [Massilia sp. DWR3-1-1]|uniref:hypothetical protein n=1 Tax=Massilia sp. DWR3-1-1 TaxID=2804559 RepID=UPI003CEF2B00
MTTATYSNDSASLRHYFSDLGNAARAFADALFAAQARQFVVQEVRASAPVAPAVKARGVRQLFSLARDVEHFSPNLAAELRNLATRD